MIENADASWWLWTSLSSGAVIVALTALFIVTSPRSSKRKLLTDDGELSHAEGEDDEAHGSGIEDEPWFPRFTVCSWEEAHQIEDCPWQFDGCITALDALARIWRQPLHASLAQTFESLKESVKDVKVARCSQGKEVHHAVVYALNTGANVFGGAPLDLPVNLDLNSEAGLSPGGLRNRRSKAQPAPVQEAPDALVPLTCLTPFFRIHDGMGVLLAMNHLPLLLMGPAENLQGSCFYIYPARAMESHVHSHLVKFARVDSKCVVCSDVRKECPYVIYAEDNGTVTEDDEEPLDFVAATAMNLTSQPTCSPWSIEARAWHPPIAA